MRDVDGEEPEADRPAGAGRGGRVPGGDADLPHRVPAVARAHRRHDAALPRHRPAARAAGEAHGPEESHMTIVHLPLRRPSARCAPARSSTPPRSSASCWWPIGWAWPRRDRGDGLRARADHGRSCPSTPRSTSRGWRSSGAGRATPCGAYRRDLHGLRRVAGRPLRRPGGRRRRPTSPPTSATCGPSGRAPASVARALAVVRNLHRFLAEEGRTAGDPAVEVAAPRVPSGLPKPLSEDEVTALLDAVVGDEPVHRRDRAILELLYGTGMRISELCGLALGDLDPDGGRRPGVRQGGQGAHRARRAARAGRRGRVARPVRPTADGAGALGPPRRRRGASSSTSGAGASPARPAGPSSPATAPGPASATG